MMFSARRRRLNIRFVKRGGWLADHLAGDFEPPALPVHAKVEERARLTNRLGAQPLWDGYKTIANYPHSTDGSRQSDDVRTERLMGRFMSWLAGARNAQIVVEFGTAFGVSGMYWLAGLQAGHLFTFEPNAQWAELARPNLAAISDAFTLTNETFEEAAGSVLQPGTVDVAFVDAIHTSEFVLRQYDVLKPYMCEHGLILFDDINFSPDMAGCWDAISREPGIRASTNLDRRVGIIEL
jgi:predicted O-methyltransferase YrrM